MLYKKYQFPLSIFLVFEKAQPIIYTSETLTFNHYICFLPKKQFFILNFFLKNELSSFTTTLSENTAIDTKNYNKISKIQTKITCDANILCIYNYFSYTTKTRISFFLSQQFNSKLQSIEEIFQNASWLERELSEMFNITFYRKKDQRLLLLDYSSKINPLLKKFNCENYSDTYFNIFDDKVYFSQSESIEL